MGFLQELGLKDRCVLKVHIEHVCTVSWTHAGVLGKKRGADRRPQSGEWFKVMQSNT